VLWENNVDLQGIGQNGDYREREEVCAQLWVEWLVLGWMDGSVRTQFLLVGWQWRERELREINGTSFYHVKQHEDRRLDVL
jgi:hypothetical protein